MRFGDGKCRCMSEKWYVHIIFTYIPLGHIVMKYFTDIHSQMQTRHSNMLAMAHFHKTQAEPALVGYVFLFIYSGNQLTNDSITNHGNPDLATMQR